MYTSWCYNAKSIIEIEVYTTMKDNKELFESMPIAAAVRKMAVPTIIGQLIVLIYSMADTFFVGRTNNPYMVAAASLILPVFNIAIPLASIAGVGGGSLISRLLGTDEKEEAKRVFNLSVYLSLAMGLIYSLVLLAFMKPILMLLGAGSETYTFAYQYALCVIVVGGVPTILSNVFSNMVRSIGNSKQAAFGVTLGGVINILLDPIFMFVILPPGMEIMGAGIATCLSNIISCIYFIVVIARLGSDSVLRLALPRALPRRTNIGMIFVVGVPAAIATLLFDMDYIVLDRLMSAYGDTALAAIGIVLKAERLPLNIGIGICQGMVPMVAYNYASGNYKRMNEISMFSLKCGVICAIISIALYEMFASYIMRFFIADTQTVALGTEFLRIRCLATLFMFMSFYHVHLFNGYGRGREALFLGVMRWAVFNIPMLFALNHIFGMYGLVWSQLTADILTVALSFAVHKRYMRISFGKVTKSQVLSEKG